METFCWEREKENMRTQVKEVGRQIIDSMKASDPGHFHAPGPFGSLPSPHPSIYLPSTHPSPLSPLLPCRAGPAFHLLSVPARSSPVHPPLAFTIQLKATAPSSSSHSSSTPSLSLSVPGWAQQKGLIPHVGMQSWHTLTKPTDDANTHWHINTQSVCKRAKERDTRRWTHSRTQWFFFSILILTWWIENRVGGAKLRNNTAEESGSHFASE